MPNRFCKRTALTVVACSLMIGGALGARQPVSAHPTRCNEARNQQLFEQRLAELLNGTLDDSTYWTQTGVVRVNVGVKYTGTYNVLNGAYFTTLNQYWSALGGPTSSAPVVTALCDKIVLRAPFAATGRRTGVAIETPVIEVFFYDNDGKIVRDEFTFLKPAQVNAVI
jgi:hypothetical protein